ncbi:O-antigen ligase [Actinacidiphila guanduensis]|uniref:O-antigen ligase n=1 Tax=Actinacidiphila guanduensis TaxID=310781 RepID=A0A1G9XYZ8_9ACTN|nr:O-antigen ligase [Actinacidiphila guanduensis]
MALTSSPAWRTGPGARLLAPLLPYARLLPALATVALLALPVAPGDVSTSGKVTPADAASAVMVLTCAVLLLRERRRPLSRTAAAVLGAPLAGFAVAAIASPDPGASVTGFVRYAQVFVLVPAALVLLLRDRRDFTVVAGAVVVLALVQGAVGTWQYATATGASYQGRDVRAVGTFGPSDIMGMATVVAYGLVIAAGYALAPGRRAPRLTAAGCALALLVPLTVSFSRGTWIATAAVLLVLTLLAGRRQAVRVLAVAAACGVVLVGGLGAGSGMLSERLASITQVTSAPDPSVTDRYTLWSAAVSMWREHPATGVGLKRFPDERDSHASLALDSASDTDSAAGHFTREPLLSPHNMYLLALSEQGLVGCALLTGSWACLLAAGAGRLRTAKRAAVKGSVGVPWARKHEAGFARGPLGTPERAGEGLAGRWLEVGPSGGRLVAPGHEGELSGRSFGDVGHEGELPTRPYVDLGHHGELSAEPYAEPGREGELPAGPFAGPGRQGELPAGPFAGRGQEAASAARRLGAQEPRGGRTAGSTPEQDATVARFPGTRPEGELPVRPLAGRGREPGSAFGWFAGVGPHGVPSVDLKAAAAFDGVSATGQFAGGTGPFGGPHSEKGGPAWASVGGSGASAARPLDGEVARQATGTPTGWRHAGGRAASVGSGLAAVGLLLWQCVDFLYADIGGPVTPLTAVVLGLAAWWALHSPEEGPR